MTYKIAIVGSNEETLGFKALGIFPHAVNSTEEAEKAIDDIIEKKEYAIIFIIENWAEKLSEKLSGHTGALPAIVSIPNYSGSTGAGEKKLRKIVEQAVGSDILFKDK